MTTLSVGGVCVGRYDWDENVPAGVVRRPAVHPLCTLGGLLLTAEHPPDHPWHRGLGLGLPDVDGVNLWGGPSYLHGVGYRDAGLGAVRPQGSLHERPDGVDDSLAWCDTGGNALLHERRSLTAAAVSDDCWRLDWTSALTPAADRPVSLGSPGSNGRTGAGYGGFFWRLPSTATDAVRVFTADAEGEAEVNGTLADWLAVRTASAAGGCTAVLRAGDERTRGDPWFVRAAGYLGVGSALAWDRPVVLPSGSTLTVSVQVLLVDRSCERADVRALLAASA